MTIVWARPQACHYIMQRYIPSGMKAAVTGLALLFAIVGGFIVFGSYLLPATNSETGAVASFLDTTWFLWLLALIAVVVIVAGGFVAAVFKRT